MATEPIYAPGSLVEYQSPSTGKRHVCVFAAYKDGRPEHVLLNCYPDADVAWKASLSTWRDYYGENQSNHDGRARKFFKAGDPYLWANTDQLYPHAKQNNNHMPSSIIDFFNNLTATPDEKLLKKYNLENPVGTPTEEGLRLSALISYKANRDKVIEIARKLEEEESAKGDKK